MWSARHRVSHCEDFAAQLVTGSEVALRDSQGVPLVVLQVSEARKRKRLLGQARPGKIAWFTGISDPDESPEQPELRNDGNAAAPAAVAREVLALLRNPDLMAS